MNWEESSKSFDGNFWANNGIETNNYTATAILTFSGYWICIIQDMNGEHILSTATSANDKDVAFDRALLNAKLSLR